MKVFVIIGVWGGCIEEVTATTDEEEANRKERQLRRSYGIRKGHESESEHAVALHEFDL